MYIKVENVSKTYDKTIKALKSVNIEFKRNKITGLIGFNGSGKTTTFNIIANFIEDYQGRILLDGKPFNNETRKKISYLSAGAEPKNPMKVKKHLYQIASLYKVPKRKAKEIIEKLSKEMEFLQFLNMPIKNLSKGNQQKIKVITTFLNPKMEILLLDEPFDGLDPIMVNKISNIFLRLKEKTIIITSHRMNVIQKMCEEFYILKDGIIIDKKKIDNNIITIATNLEIPLEKIKNMDGVLLTKKSKKENLIEIKNISYFKKINKILIKNPNYKYSTIKEKNIAESVFEGYGEENV
jgi:ABC-2 type transport system ATP-binding protein